MAELVSPATPKPDTKEGDWKGKKSWSAGFDKGYERGWREAKADSKMKFEAKLKERDAA